MSNKCKEDNNLYADTFIVLERITDIIQKRNKRKIRLKDNEWVLKEGRKSCDRNKKKMI